MRESTAELFARAKQISVLDLVRDKTNLKKRSDTWYDGPCPSCGGDDRFWINTRKNVCNCRQCGLGGDATSFWATLRSIPMVDAAKELLGETEVPREWAPRVVEHIEKPPVMAWKDPEWQLQASNDLKRLKRAGMGNEGGVYLQKRGVMDPEIVDLYQIGFDPERFSKADEAKLPAIMIPWIYQGEIVNIRYRFINAQKTRFNSKSGGNPIIFGTNVECKSTRLNLTEGEMNCIAVKCACPGYHAWSIGSQHNLSGVEAAVEECKARGIEEVVLWFDDRKYAENARQLVEGAGMKCGIVVLDDRDANDMIVESGAPYLSEIASKAFAKLIFQDDPAMEEAREFTDYINGSKIVQRYGDEFRFVVQTGDFATWDECRWAITPLGKYKVREWAVSCAKSITDDLRPGESPARAKERLKWGVASLNTKGISNAIYEAGARQAVSILDFDHQPWLLNVKNGVVNLRTGELKEHDRNLLLSQCCGTKIAPKGSPKPELFIGFMKRIIPDSMTRKFVYQYLGYTLTGDVSETCYVFFHGGGKNGKSTLINIMQYIMGDYAMRILTSSLMESKGGYGVNTEYEFARLRGKRFVVAHEVSDDHRLNESTIKELTGDDVVRARQIRGEPFEFPCLAKIYMTGNSKPTIYGTDNAIWRRVDLVPFNVQITAEERDKSLKSKLEAEAPLILRYLVDCCVRWQATGLERSEAMLEAKDEYQRENDFMATFLDEDFVYGNGLEIGCTKLHQHYLAWAKRNGCIPMNPTKFGLVIKKKFEPLGIKKKKSNGLYKWIGVDEKQSEYEGQGQF